MGHIKARAVSEMVNEGHENPSPAQGDIAAAAASPQMPAKEKVFSKSHAPPPQVLLKSSW